MVKCICINDANKPKKVPLERWVKKGNEYTVIFVTTVLPERKMAFLLEEIELDKSCFPYEYYSADRFAFSPEELDKLRAFIKDCDDISIQVKELLSTTNERTANTI